MSAQLSQCSPNNFLYLKNKRLVQQTHNLNANSKRIKKLILLQRTTLHYTNDEKIRSIIISLRKTCIHTHTLHSHNKIAKHN